MVCLSVAFIPRPEPVEDDTEAPPAGDAFVSPPARDALKLPFGDRAVSDCSTCDSLTPTSSASDSETIREDLIIFDWDDTLLPTTWLKAVQTRSGAANGKILASQLRAHRKLVKEALRTARATAGVAIVTLATRDWFWYSAKEFLHGLDMPALLSELGIRVYFAREDDDSQGTLFAAEDWEALKQRAMAHCLADWQATLVDKSSATPSVLSIGDSTIEQEALKRLLSADVPDFARRPLCKTLKLVEAPRLSELGEELRRLSAWLRRLAFLDRGFEIRAEQPAQLQASQSFAGI